MFLPAKKSLGIMASEQLICYMKKFLIQKKKPCGAVVIFPHKNSSIDKNAGCYEMFVTTFITPVFLIANNFFLFFLRLMTWSQRDVHYRANCTWSLSYKWLSAEEMKSYLMTCMLIHFMCIIKNKL